MSALSIVDAEPRPDPTAELAARPPRLLLTFAEAGAVLGVSAMQVRRLVDSDELAAVYLGRLHRIAHVDLEEYVDRLRRQRSPRVGKR